MQQLSRRQRSKPDSGLLYADSLTPILYLSKSAGRFNHSTSRPINTPIVQHANFPTLQQPVRELWIFGYRNALSCIFPVAIFLLLAISHKLPDGFLSRYDFMLVACIVV